MALGGKLEVGKEQLGPVVSDGNAGCVRLPRPDRKGTFLYIAGIHATGTLGAVRYIENHLPDLYNEVKTRGFSAVVRATCDESRTPTATELATPIYRNEVI